MPALDTSAVPTPPESRDLPAVSPFPATVWLVAALAVLLRVAVALATRYTSEDYLITLRYAENLAHGHGLVYNAGERVLGTTTPLYTLLLAGVTWLGLPATVVGKAVGIAADGLLCLVAYRWLSERGHAVAGMAAAIFLALHPTVVRWSISGMETSLATLCGTWVWYEYSRGRVAPAYGWLGVLFLLRWDSVMMLVVLTAAVVWRERRLPWRGLALYAALILPWIVGAWWYYGNPIPVTGHAKMVVYGWRYRDRFLPELGHLAARFVGTAPYLAVTLCALVGLWRASKERMGWLLPPVAWFFLYWAVFLASKVLLFEWYVVPVLPVYAALFGLGLVALTRPVAERIRPGTGHALVAALTAALGMGIAILMTGMLRESQRIEENLRIPIGRYLAENVKPEERVMLEPIGYIGYYSGRRVLDFIGLVSPEVLTSYRPDVPSPVLDIARRFRPEWAVLRPGELRHITDVDRAGWEREYALVKTFAYTPRPDRELIVFYVFKRRAAADSFNAAAPRMRALSAKSISAAAEAARR